MTQGNNIVLTGGLHCGKSTIVRRAVATLAVDFLGVLCEPVIRKNIVMGYGLRMVGKSGLHIFAHVNIKSMKRFGKYGIDLAPFDRAAEYIEKSLLQHPRLFVIDEIGPVEDAVPKYKLALDGLFNSHIPSLVVVQRRAKYLQEVKTRQDVILLELTNNHRALAGQILNLLKEIAVIIFLLFFRMSILI